MSKEGVLFRKIAAFNEISLLVFSLVAFVFIIGESERVSAFGEGIFLPIIPYTDAAGGTNLLNPEISSPAPNPTGTQGAAYGSQNLGGKEESLTIPSKDPETSGGLGIEGFISELFGGGIGKGWGIGNLVAGVAWGGVVAGVIQMAGGLLGADGQTVNALSVAAWAGFAAGGGIMDLVVNGWIGTGGTQATFLGLTPTATGVLGGIVVAAVVFAVLYKKESKKVVELQCLPWEAPLGGGDCEKCNQDPIRPCSEYRCKALGQACELVNKGSEGERWGWVARNDVKS